MSRTKRLLASEKKGRERERDEDHTFVTQLALCSDMYESKVVAEGREINSQKSLELEFFNLV